MQGFIGLNLQPQQQADEDALLTVGTEGQTVIAGIQQLLADLKWLHRALKVQGSGTTMLPQSTTAGKININYKTQTNHVAGID